MATFAGTNLILLLALFSFTNSNQFKQHSIQGLEGRVVHGHRATAEKYPFIAYLLYGPDSGKSSNESCTGSILQLEDPPVILTAAHCLSCKHLKNLRVYLGRDKAVKPEEFANDADYYKVAGYVIHEEYDDETSDNDIGLIFLAKEPKEDGLETVELPDTDDDVYYCESGEPLRVIGYGKSRESKDKKDFTETLNYADLRCADWDKCKNVIGDYHAFKRWYCHDDRDNTTCAKVEWSKFVESEGLVPDQYFDDDDEVTENMLCAFAWNSSVCQGDSGGPLIKKDTKIQIGITSSSHGCGRHLPAFYTNLYRKKEWIHDKIEDYEEDPESFGIDDCVGECKTNSFMADIYIYDAVYNEWLPWCTGSILSVSPTVILTSAFCLQDVLIYELGVYLLPSYDAYDNNTDIVNSSLITISTYEIHPNYNSSSGDNDIGLVFLDESMMEFNDTEITAIHLSSTKCDPDDDAVQRCDEYGGLALIGFEDKMLEYTDAPCIEHKACISRLDEYYDLAYYGLTTVIDEDGICIDIPESITDDMGFDIDDDRIRFDGILVGWDGDDDECKLYGQGRKRIGRLGRPGKDKGSRGTDTMDAPAPLGSKRGSKRAPIKGGNASAADERAFFLDDHLFITGHDDLPWVYNNLCGYTTWIEQTMNEYQVLLAIGNDTDCRGLTEMQCSQIVDRNGYLKCGWNSIYNECYGIVKAAGNIGIGTFDDGYIDGESVADKEVSKLWIAITVESIAMGILSIIIFFAVCSVYFKKKKNMNRDQLQCDD